MWNPFSVKKTLQNKDEADSAQTAEPLTFRISNMHCSSCAMSIDGALEELPGVRSARTSYAKGLTEIEYDPKLVTVEKIKKIIAEAGYEVEGDTFPK